MHVLRTPDERFAFVDFYTPKYAQITPELRMAYVDEGPRGAAETILLLHGEPTWSYLYRKMIPGLVQAGYRVIAPDLIGFGRSDKPSSQDDYTYARQVAWVAELVGHKHLDLRAATFFGQDWGGLIGLRVVAENEERFARVVVSNTALPDGRVAVPGVRPQQPFPAGHPWDWRRMCAQGTQRLDKARVQTKLNFPTWRAYANECGELDIASVVDAMCTTTLSPAERRAYDAPFPDESYKAGARKMPLCVPITADDPALEANEAAWRVFRRWWRPFLTVWGRKDPLMGADEYYEAVVQKGMIGRVPGAARLPHAQLPDACHFIQEDAGPELVRHIVALVSSTPRNAHDVAVAAKL